MEDFAFDLLVLELASGKSFQALADLVGHHKDGATITVLSLSLLCMRVHLYGGVNLISLRPMVQVTFIWLSMLFVKSIMKGVSPITKRNYVA
jgi:hypothetical protein